MIWPMLNEHYWTQEFAVTDGDLGRVYVSLQQGGHPQTAMALLSQVVRRKLEKESLEVDAEQRRKSEAAAQQLLRDQTARVYHQTGEYEIGDRLLVARGSTGERQYGVGEVVAVKAATEPHLRWTITLRFADGDERKYVAGADLSHPRARGWKLFDVRESQPRSLEQTLNHVLRIYGSMLLSHLLGRLDGDTRFVRWGQACWLVEALPALPEDALDQVAIYLWTQGAPAMTDDLLQALNLPVDEPHRWPLNLALASDNRFDNAGTEDNPQWTAPLPDHLLRLTDGTLIDLSTSPNELWAQHHALFRGPLPAEWSENPHVLTFGGRWLLDTLLAPIDDDELNLVREYLEAEGQAVSDVELLEGLFGITPGDDAFERWRFTLSYRLSRQAERLGVEFVGAGQAWAWALQEASIEKPERHRRLRGAEGLPTVYVTADQVAEELIRDEEPLDVTAEEQEGEWKPSRHTWEYVLTYYDWDNGVLPYNRQAQELIPPLSEGQRRAVFRFAAEQVDDQPFEVTLYADPRAPWLHGLGLKDFFVGYLVPGARIWVDRTEELGLYKIRYRPTEPQRRKLLFFEDGRVRPDVREVEIACEVDDTMLLAEGRYSNVEALERLDLVDRRTAPKVLARVFELIGEHDEARGVYCATFDDVFPLLCITKPYSKAYVQHILYDRTNHPWFYRDEERGPAWFVYDPQQIRVRRPPEQVALTPPPPVPAQPTEATRQQQVQPGEEVPAVAPPFFIFQQHPAGESEYADQIGKVYNWRQGIPGSNQIVEGARFIYYRPGEQVFFGTGRVASIDTYAGDDGQTYYNGHIAEYEAWDPPLPLTHELAAQLSFVPPSRLGVGPAGIRKIGQADFETILQACREMQSGARAELAQPPKLAVERTHTGQLIASELVPPGPLFEERPPSPAAAAEQADLPTTPPTPPQDHTDLPPSSPTVRRGRGAGGEGEGRPPPQPTRPRTASKSLFSQHYLEHRIQEHPEWAEDVTEAFERLRALYAAKRPILPSLNEAQTEEEFIRPALELLGFAYVPQTAVRRGGRVQRPDYALFPDARAKDEAYGYVKEEPAFYGRALAIADAKYWSRPLSEVSRDDPRDEFRNTNPSFQMVNYLTGTGVDWGILTNGQTWRIYYRQASSTATEFYEVDLVDLLESGDPDRFKYFWLFFRREAFIKDAQERNFLERVREGSATYARVIGDRLKGLVFDEVFPLLAGGFVAYGAARGEDLTDDAGRRLVYEATLSLLYKLLFLLYAEARGLLPMDNLGYRAQSLVGMAREVAARLDRAESLGETSTALYDQLLNLFQLIDQGDRGLGLPRYNGGLFHFDFSEPDDQEKRRANWFLTRHKVSDAVLAPALDRLARIDGEPIDYGFIGVRHLGAIYEGLLEHRLVVGRPAETSEVSEDFGSLEYAVHLETDKGERKATGSYYTPDYIVKYIVQHTVGPILEERAQRFGELMGEIVPRKERVAELDANIEGTPPAGWGARWRDERRFLRQELKQLQQQARETLLDIKVCDPAMGSGHFLVEAVDFLTDGLIEILNRYPEHNPVLQMLDRIREEIVDSLERQGIAIDPGRLDDTQLLQRVVMKRCIYGVDLNSMAVELAKVSLWLHSFTIGAPLSFLDHHLRHGNSLIGAMTREVDEDLRTTERSQRISREARMAAEARGKKVREVATGYQAELWGGPFAGLLRAAEIMRGISLLSDATFAEVEESERLFRQFDEAAEPYKRLLDIYVARHFGVERADEFLRLYGADAIQAGPDTVGEPYATVLREARRLYEEKRFFHWDLEFPEVFIDLERATWKENPGFDAVVGNPPWVNIGREPGNELLVRYLKANFDAAEYQVDLYTLFLEQDLDLLSTGSFLGMIVPDPWLANYRTPRIRKLLLVDNQPIQLMSTPRSAFPEVGAEHLILIVQCYDGCVHPFVKGRLDEFGRPLIVDEFPCRLLREQDGYVVYSTSQASGMLHRIESLSTGLGNLFETVRGIGPYHHRKHSQDIIESRAFHADHKKDETFVPQLRGEHLGRYEITWDGNSWISYGPWLAEPRERRFFEGKRLLLREILARRFVACVLEKPFIVDRSIYIALQGDKSLDLHHVLAVAASSLLIYWFREKFNEWDEMFPKLRVAHFNALPIRRIAFTTPTDKRARLAEAGITEAAEFTEHTEGASVASVPFRAFSGSNLGRWLDERLSPVHTPDPELVRRHNTDPLNEDWQLPEAGPVEQSDVVHDLLAHLAGQMIEMNKQKQAEIKGFLAWLEREIGASIDNLTNKTKLRNYLGDYQKGDPHLTLEELLTILRKNRRRLQVDPTARAFQERLAQEFQASLDRLLPLKGRLAATDRLIDLIVYRLYGLTEEEVAIVEGSDT